MNSQSTNGREQDILKHHSVQPRKLTPKFDRSRGSADVMKRMSHSLVNRRSDDGSSSHAAIAQK
eukprot:scaffold655217_cov60-Prasinocladus_malaysianus.AAC.1